MQLPKPAASFWCLLFLPETVIPWQTAKALQPTSPADLWLQSTMAAVFAVAACHLSILHFCYSSLCSCASTSVKHGLAVLASKCKTDRREKQEEQERRTTPPTKPTKQPSEQPSNNERNQKQPNFWVLRALSTQRCQSSPRAHPCRTKLCRKIAKCKCQTVKNHHLVAICSTSICRDVREP